MAMAKPLSVARIEYMNAISEITNKSGLPAFVILEVIERFRSQLESLAQAEVQRDTALWKAEMAKATEADKAEDEPSE